MFRGVVTASLVSLALVGCSAQSLSPLQRADPSVPTSHAIHADSGFNVQPQLAVLKWNPTSIKLTDAGPYVATTLKSTKGDTVVVDYDDECNYRIDLDFHPGPSIHHVETDGYNFYAYSGKSGSPAFHCLVNALLKDAGGKVIAHATLAVTITYPRKHQHGG